MPPQQKQKDPTVQLVLGFIGLIHELVGVLVEMNQRLDRIEKKADEMDPQIQAILDEVAVQTTVNEGAVKLLGQLTGLVQQHINDPVALQQVLDGIKNNDAALGDAVVANTPAA